LGRARKLRLIGIISQMGSGVRPNHSLSRAARRRRWRAVRSQPVRAWFVRPHNQSSPGIANMITVFGEGRGFRVVWLLEEMGLAYQLRPVDLLAGVEEDAEFLAINPAGFIPAI